MKISFQKRLGFFLRGRADKNQGQRCPYTPNSKEANWWWRGYIGKKRPINPLVYTIENDM